MRFRSKVILTVLLLAVVLAHRFGLHWVAQQTVCQQAVPEQADVLLAGGYGTLDVAAEMVLDGRCGRILLLQKLPARTVEIDATEDEIVLVKRNLERRGVSLQQVEAIPGNARTRWDAARQLQDWLRRDSSRRIHVLCEAFTGKSERIVLDRTLGPELAARVTVHGIHDPRYDATTWWRSRLGLRAVFAGYVGLFYTAIVGEPDPLPWYASADEYESQFLEELRAKYGIETARSGAERRVHATGIQR